MEGDEIGFCELANPLEGKTMLSLLLVTTRQKDLDPFIECLSSDPDVRLTIAASGTKAIDIVRADPPRLVIIDFELPDIGAMRLVSELIMVNAMVNTAVVSPLTEQEFHEAGEGLGILAGLPLAPGEGEARELLCKLRTVLGMAS